MTLRIEEVPFQLVNKVWDNCAPYIHNALQYSHDEYTVDQAKVYVINGLWVLYMFFGEANEVKGAAVVQYFNRPNDRVAMIVALGGRNVTTKVNAEKLFDLFRANGATCVEAAARDEILRLWGKVGLEKIYTIVSKKL